MLLKRITNQAASFGICSFGLISRLGILCALTATLFSMPLQAQWIDGIKFRLGINIYSDDLKIDGIGTFAQNNKYINSQLIFDEEIPSIPLNLEQFGLEQPYKYTRGDEAIGSVLITLPESTLGPFLFYGANIDWIFNGKIEDLTPAEESSQTVTTASGETLLRQDDEMLSNILNNFFNIKDRAFTSMNPDYWALSADITKNVLMFGYSFGIFLPIGEYHRFFKVSYGLGYGWYQYLVDINLCEKYTLNEIAYNKKEEKSYYEGKCVGKIFIDQAKLSGTFSSVFRSTVFWERVTEDTVMSLLKVEKAEGEGEGKSDLKNHQGTVSTNVLFDRIEFFSFTYRF